MFGTLHHTQPGLAFILKRSEEKSKEEKKIRGGGPGRCFYIMYDKIEKQLKDATSEWKALYQSVSPSHWRMSEMSSSSGRTPCWGLVCKRWSSDLHPLPELQTETCILNSLTWWDLKIKQKKSNLYQISSHLSFSSADKHIHCIYLVHLKLRFLMVLSKKKKKNKETRSATG